MGPSGIRRLFLAGSFFHVLNDAELGDMGQVGMLRSRVPKFGSISGGRTPDNKPKKIQRRLSGVEEGGPRPNRFPSRPSGLEGFAAHWILWGPWSSTKLGGQRRSVWGVCPALLSERCRKNVRRPLPRPKTLHHPFEGVIRVHFDKDVHLPEAAPFFGLGPELCLRLRNLPNFPSPAALCSE